MFSRDDILFLTFGLPTWILVDGTWSVLSQIAVTQPEGFTISSYLVLALTFGNLSSFVSASYLHSASSEKLIYFIRVLLTIGLVCGIFLANFWSSTINGLSIPLYATFFVIGACSSSSNITHYMFVSSYPARFTTMMATGFGLGPMISGILALFQGFLLNSYGFSLLFYYLMLTAFYIPAMVSLRILTKPRELRSISVNYTEIENPKEFLTTNHPTDMPSNEQEFLVYHQQILFLQFVISCFGYGLIPAIISFACSKFDHRETVLLVATATASCCNPWFRMLTEYYQLKNIFHFILSVCVLLSLAFGIIVCASLPQNAAIHRGYGGALPVLLYISFSGLFGYTSTCFFRFLKSNVNPICIQHAYRWGGIVTQAGATLGSIVTFILIITEVFH